MTESVIVTGCHGGHGREIVKAFADPFHWVIGVDKSSPQLPVEPNFVFVPGDVRDPSVINNSFDLAIQKNSTNLKLALNAGISISDASLPQYWNETIDVNLSSNFFWLEALAQHMKAGSFRSASVVLIGSLASVFGMPGNPAYNASKAGILGLARSYAVDLGGLGVRVNVVSPGYIHTAMTTKSFHDEEKNIARARHSVLGRWGAASEVASAVKFLLSREASFITGVDLPVDGGWRIKGLNADN